MTALVLVPRDAYEKGYQRAREGRWWALSWFDVLNPFHGEMEEKLQRTGYRDGMKDFMRQAYAQPDARRKRGSGGHAKRHGRRRNRRR